MFVVHTVQRFLSSESSSRSCTTCQRRALVCKSIRETHEPKQVPTDATEELEKESTGEPPESDHPKCADLVVANGRWSLTKIEPQTTGGFFEKKTGHIHFKEDNLLHAISKLRYVQFHVVVVPTSRDQKTRQVVAYKRLKTM